MSTPKTKRPPVDRANPPRVMSPAEAAAFLDLSDDAYYSHVHPHIVRGEILSLRIGRQRRIITASLLAWAEQRAKDAA